MPLIKPRDISEETPLDRIYKAFISHKLDDLHQSDQDILTRITEIDKQITARKPVSKKINGEKIKYSRPYQYKELAEWTVERFGVSHRQAYIDIEMSKRFFLSCETRDDKEFARGQRIAIGDDLMFLAVAKGDLKAAAAFFKEVNEIRGLKRSDPETLNPEDSVPTDMIIVDDPSEIGFEKVANLSQLSDELLKEFKGKTMKNVIDSAEDTTYESEEAAT
jgi:hypothetical protein